MEFSPLWPLIAARGSQQLHASPFPSALAAPDSDDKGSDASHRSLCEVTARFPFLYRWLLSLNSRSMPCIQHSSISLS